MAKFVFKMQSILNIKEKLETQEKVNYGILRGTLTEEEQRLEALYIHKSDLIELKTRQMSRIINARELQISENAIAATDQNIFEQQKAVKRAEKALEVQRQKLAEAMKERKTFEKLRENAYRDFVKELDYAEQKEIDELVSYRHGLQAI